MRTTGLIQKVEQRLVAYKGRRSAKQLPKSLGVTREIMRLIIREDLNLRPCRNTTRPKLSNDNKKQRVSFAYWVQKFLKKEDHGKILFTDETYFSVEDIFSRQNKLIYAASRLETDEQGGIKQKSKYSKRLIVWLGASKNGLASPIIFKSGGTFSHENYIEIILPRAHSEGERLLGDDFIFQQDHTTPHTHRELLA